MEPEWASSTCNSYLLVRGPGRSHLHASNCPRRPRAHHCCHQPCAPRGGAADIEAALATALSRSTGGRVRRIRAARVESLETLPRSWPGRAIAALGRAMRFNNGWRRGGLRSSRSSQTTPTSAVRASQIVDSIEENTSSGAFSTPSSHPASAEHSDTGGAPIPRVESATVSPSPSSVGVGRPPPPPLEPSAASCLETLVRCTSLTHTPEPCASPGTRTRSGIPDDPGGALIISTSDGEDVVAESLQLKEPADKQVIVTSSCPTADFPPEALLHGPSEDAAPIRPAESALESVLACHPLLCAPPRPQESTSIAERPPVLPLESSPAQTCPSEQPAHGPPDSQWYPYGSLHLAGTGGDSLAANVKEVADILRALEEIGERVAPFTLDPGHPGSMRPERARAEEPGGSRPRPPSPTDHRPAPAEHTEGPVVSGGRSDPSLLMLALRQDGDHSVLLLTLLDEVCPSDAQDLSRLVRDCKSNMAALTSALSGEDRSLKSGVLPAAKEEDPPPKEEQVALNGVDTEPKGADTSPNEENPTSKEEDTLLPSAVLSSKEEDTPLLREDRHSSKEECTPLQGEDHASTEDTTLKNKDLSTTGGDSFDLLCQDDNSPHVGSNSALKHTNTCEGDSSPAGRRSGDEAHAIETEDQSQNEAPLRVSLKVMPLGRPAITPKPLTMLGHPFDLDKLGDYFGSSSNPTAETEPHLGDLGELGVQAHALFGDKFRSVPQWPSPGRPNLPPVPGRGGERGAARGGASAPLEEAKRRVVLQSRPSEVVRPTRGGTLVLPKSSTSKGAVPCHSRCPLPRAAPASERAPDRGRCARRGAWTTSRMGVGCDEEVSTRTRPRGCRLPALQSSAACSGLCPHRASKASHQVAQHMAHQIAHRLTGKDALALRKLPRAHPSRNALLRTAAAPPPASDFVSAPAPTAPPQRTSRRKTLSVSFKEPP